MPAQKAGILADLVVAPLPLSACQGDIIPLSGKHDLPELPDYTMGLLINKDASEPVRAVADHLRVSLNQRSGPI